MFSRVLKTLGILLLCSGPLFSQGGGQFGNGSSSSGNALTSQPLSQFASTTSLQLAGVISDETGTGQLVFATSPNLVTPSIGAATGTSLALTGALSSGAVSGASGLVNLVGSVSGTATITGPATAGTVTNPIAFSNVITTAPGTLTVPNIAPSNDTSTGFSYPGSGEIWFISQGNIILSVKDTGSFAIGSAQSYQITSGVSPHSSSPDVGISRLAAGYLAFDGATIGNKAAYLKSAMTVTLSADWTCGTGGTVSSCAAATIVGSTATPLTFTLPSVAATWHFDCDLVVGQATAATANQWNLLTATNGVTSTTAAYQMATAAGVAANGAITDQASTTTTFQIAPSWTLGGTATKMPVHIAGTLTGASASGTVFSLQLLAPTVGDLVTIYEGSGCSVRP